MRLGKNEKKILLCLYSAEPKEFQTSYGDKDKTGIFKVVSTHGLAFHVWGKYTPKIASLRAQACRRLYQKGYITYRVGECRPGISEPFLSYKGKCGVVLTEKGEEKGRELANEIDNYLGEWGKYSSVVAEEIRKLNSQREEYQRKFNKLS